MLHVTYLSPPVLSVMYFRKNIFFFLTKTGILLICIYIFKFKCKYVLVNTLIYNVKTQVIIYFFPALFICKKSWLSVRQRKMSLFLIYSFIYRWKSTDGISSRGQSCSALQNKGTAIRNHRQKVFEEMSSWKPSTMYLMFQTIISLIFLKPVFSNSSRTGRM